MLFLVEVDHVESGNVSSPDAGRGFIEQIIFPTLARLDQLVADKSLVSGGPVAGRVAGPLLDVWPCDSWSRRNRQSTSIGSSRVCRCGLSLKRASRPS